MQKVCEHIEVINEESFQCLAAKRAMTETQKNIMKRIAIKMQVQMYNKLNLLSKNVALFHKSFCCLKG